MTSFDAAWQLVKMPIHLDSDHEDFIDGLSVHGPVYQGRRAGMRDTGYWTPHKDKALAYALFGTRYDWSGGNKIDARDSIPELYSYDPGEHDIFLPADTDYMPYDLIDRALALRRVAFKDEYGDIEGKGDLSKGCRNGNAYIILGRDRNHDLTSGFGGTKNLPASYAIDLVAGLASSHRSKGSALGQETITGKNFYTDAARVYISQRTDLDTYFGITEGMKYKPDSKDGCSGVGIKADSVLLNGRRNVKIRAGGAHGDNLPRGGEKMSHGQDIPSAGNAPRIELLVANMETEPAVLGDYLDRWQMDLLETLEGLIDDLITKVAFITTAPGAPTGPNPANKAMLSLRKLQLKDLKDNIQYFKSEITKIA